ncbi:MAG: toprim domain-containing protein [Desulfobacteraceae bacterium]|nr:MAG: toprim domain-containing protein [Desulfobacteraceae bacterium]
MITDILQKRGFTLKKKTANEFSCPCPFCGGDDRFCVWPEKNRAQCIRGCGWKGDDIQLLRELDKMSFQEAAAAVGRGDKARSPASTQKAQVSAAFPERQKAYTMPDEKKALQAHERLLKDADALSYVTETRKIGRETLIHFRLGLEVDGAGIRWLTIPHYEKGKLINIKSRRLPPIPSPKDRFKRVKGCRSILFNVDVLQENPEEVYIAEGEIDAITLYDQGYKNVVSGTTGAGAFDPAWIDQLAKVKRIILCYDPAEKDPDGRGQKGARELARRLGYDRCLNVVLPDGQDVNDFFKGHDIFDFQGVLNQAKKFNVAGIVFFSDALEDFRKEWSNPNSKETGIRTGWPPLDRIIKTGFMPGELIVLSAPPKIGKSTFALQIITHNALQKIPSLFFCLEMRPRKVTEKIIQCQTRREEPGEIGIEHARDIFSGKPLYLGFSFQKPTLDAVMETLKAAIRRYGLKLLCFDHLHFLCRSLANQVQEVGLAVQAFKFLAEEMEVPIILIAQPRKIQADSIMTAMDLKDSSSIFSDCDHLIIMHRQRQASTGKDVKKGAPLQEQAFSPQTLIRVEASRYNPGGEALLYFHGEFSRFDEIERNR